MSLAPFHMQPLAKERPYERGIMPTIYIAGPYTRPDPVVNTRIAILVGRQIRDSLGVRVIVPHYSHFEHLVAPAEYPYWLAIDLDLLDLCDAIYRIQGESSGADKEVDYAMNVLKIPAFCDDPTHERLAQWVAEWKREYGGYVGLSNEKLAA